MTQRKSGRPRRLFASLVGALVLLYLGCPVSVQASITASLDRYRMAMGETVRLTLSSDDGSNPADVDLSELELNFEIMQRSSNSSTRIINGQRTQNRELLLELTPRREGRFVIPAFEVDGERSEPLSVDVGPEPDIQAADEVVIFEAEIDRNEVYVQGQLLLTLRVQQAINLESRSITELEVDNAYVEELGQNSFQRTIDGRPWLVHEIRYAIFPESSGEITIPEQTFSGRVGSGRRTLFDTRPSGRLIRRRSEALIVPVKQRPEPYPDATWLPAENLMIEEQWSAPLDKLKIGDSVTRTISLTADGLQGAQLPPIALGDIDGLRVYPDQPTINNVSGDKGITGLRSESLALVAVADGVFELPAIEIPWWDTQSDSLKIARLPQRRVSVVAPPRPAVEKSASPAEPLTAPPATVREAGSSPGYWPWITALCATGWLVSSVLWWRRRDASVASREADSSSAVTSPREVRGSSKARLQTLLKACDENDASAAQHAFRAWIASQGHLGATEDWLQRQSAPELSAAVNALARHLYRNSETDWNGSALAAALRKLPKRAETSSSQGGSLPPLYLSR